MGKTIKSIAFGLIALLLTFPLFGEDIIPQVIGPFGGLNDADNPISIPSNKAQDLLNVEITPGGRSVKKRKGIGLSSTLAISTSPVHGVHTFYDSSGNTVDLYFNDTRMSVSINNASPSVVMSTGPNGATYQCVDSQGQSYCANTSRTNIIKTNGSTFGPISNLNSTGTLVAVTPERLVTAGFSSAQNRIDFSKANDFNTWAVGGSPTDPVQITITSPGARITHLSYAHGRIYWWKETSFGYVQFGTTLADWIVRTVSPNVGTLDNSDIIRDDTIYFRANDSHYYAYDGSNLVKLSRDIGASISLSQLRIFNFLTETDATDWGAATYDTPVYVDTETVSGNIQTTFPDLFTSFRDGTSGTKDVWNTYTGGGSPPTCTFSASGEMVIQNTGGSLGECHIYTSTRVTDFKIGTTYYVVVSSMGTSSSVSGSALHFAIQPSLITSPSVGPGGSVVNMQFDSTTTGRGYLTTFTVNSVSSVPATPTYSLPATIQIFIATTTYALTINGVRQVNGTHAATTGGQYIYMGYKRFDSGTGSLKLDNFSITPQTFTYTSPNLSVGSAITAWDSFNYTDNVGGGTLTYRFGSTNTAIVSDITNSTPITNGQIPIVATATYAGVRALFGTDSWDDQPTLNSYTINWFEGSASDKMYATYFNDGLWFSVTSGTGATTNNRIHRFDMINQDWTIYDLGNNGMFVKNNALYLGSATGGKIFKYGENDNDNGMAINAYWKSKDFISDSPFTVKDYPNLSVSAGSVQNSSMTVTYTVDGSSSSSYQFPLYQPRKSFQNYNRNLPQGVQGNTINVKFGNNAADQPFEVFGAQIGIRPKSWTPSR